MSAINRCCSGPAIANLEAQENSNLRVGLSHLPFVGPFISFFNEKMILAEVIGAPKERVIGLIQLKNEYKKASMKSCLLSAVLLTVGVVAQFFNLFMLPAIAIWTLAAWLNNSRINKNEETIAKIKSAEVFAGTIY